MCFVLGVGPRQATRLEDLRCNDDSASFHVVDMKSRTLTDRRVLKPCPHQRIGVVDEMTGLREVGRADAKWTYCRQHT